jgi:hypothetical protein
MDRLTIVMQRQDERPLGSFREVRKILRGIFRNVRFEWTSDGFEQMRLLNAKGFMVSDAFRRETERIESALDGGVTCLGQMWEFSLGLKEPVVRLYVNVISLHNSVPGERDRLIKALESAFTAVSTPTNSWPGRPYLDPAPANSPEPSAPGDEVR